MCVPQSFFPGTDLDKIRVLPAGILPGIAVTVFVFRNLWPVLDGPS